MCRGLIVFLMIDLVLLFSCTLANDANKTVSTPVTMSDPSIRELGEKLKCTNPNEDLSTYENRFNNDAIREKCVEGHAGVIWLRIWKAFMTGDLLTVLNYIADDAELVFYGPGTDVIPFFQTFYGPTGLIQHLQISSVYVKSVQRFATGMVADTKQVFFTYDYIKTLKNNKVVMLKGAFFVTITHGKVQKWKFWCSDTYTLAKAMEDLVNNETTASLKSMNPNNVVSAQGIRINDNCIEKKSAESPAGVVWTKIWDAFMSGDLPTALSYIDDNAQLTWYGPGDIIPFLKTFYGPSGLVQHLQITAKYIKSVQRFPTAMIADANQVFFAYDYIKTMRDDKLVYLNGVFFVDIRHGKVQKWKFYCSDTYALAKAMEDLL
jgi:hypothetical protein